MSSPARSAKRSRSVGGTAPPPLPERTPDMIEDVGEEQEGGRKQVYLVTISRVLPAVLESGAHCQIQDLATADVAAAVRDCLENPLVSEAGGRRSAREGPACPEVGCREGEAQRWRCAFPRRCRLGHPAGIRARQACSSSAEPHAEPLVVFAHAVVERLEVLRHPI